MTSHHTLRLFFHAVALVIEAIGTFLVWKDTERISYWQHAAAMADFSGTLPAHFYRWYYNSAGLGFGLLFLGMLVAAFVLWLEHRAIVSSSPHSVPCAPPLQNQEPDHKA